MKTDNAVECGAQCEVFSHGMLRAYFSPDNRIKRLEIVFDVMSFMQQLQRAVGRGEFRMVPNTVSERVNRKDTLEQERGKYGEQMFFIIYVWGFANLNNILCLFLLFCCSAEDTLDDVHARQNGREEIGT